MKARAQYHHVFQHSAYIVWLDDRAHRLRLDAPNLFLKELSGVRQGWALITAHNPLPQILSTEENRRRNEALAALLDRQGYRYFPALGKGKDWEEESFLIVGITRSEALHLARAFGQLAILWGRDDSPAQIVYTDEEE